MASNEKKVPRILIDTDAGVDDISAISMVLSAHKKKLVEVCAITTVNGNTTVENVNRNVLRLLDAIQMMHIPVYSGAQSPLVHPYQCPEFAFHGKDGFRDIGWPYPTPEEFIQKESAVTKIIQEAKEHKGNLVIITLGPLTNIALAKMVEPELFSYLHSLHIMGGNTTGEGNDSACGEFNFSSDAEAAQIVLSDKRIKREKSGGEEAKDKAVCDIYITPWETCFHYASIPKEFRGEIGKAGTVQAKLLNAAEYKSLTEDLPTDFSTMEYVMNCDQLCAAWMLDLLLKDKIWPSEEKANYLSLSAEVTVHSVTVETQGTHTRGMMVLDRRGYVDYAIPANILTRVNLEVNKRYLKLSFGLDF